MVKGNEVDEEVDLEQLFNKADKAIAPIQVLEDEPKDRAENLIEREVCSQTDCQRAFYLRDRMTHRSLSQRLATLLKIEPIHGKEIDHKVDPKALRHSHLREEA